MSAVPVTEQQQQVQRASLQIDPEKNAVATNEPQELNGDEKKYDTDGSENFQDGVNRIRAITSVWSTKTLILVFALYVSPTAGAKSSPRNREIRPLTPDAQALPRLLR